MVEVDDMVDTIHADVSHLPPTLRKVLGYVTGTPDIQWTAGDWARFPRAAKVRLSQWPGQAVFTADGFDIEPGAWTVQAAVNGARARRQRGQRTLFYLPRSLWGPARAAVAIAGLGGWVDYGIADWSLSRAQAAELLGGRVVFVQYASPTSNPHTVIPGTRLTLAQANADLSVTLASWHPEPGSRRARKIRRRLRRAKPHPKVLAAGGGVSAGTLLAGLLGHAHVHLTPAEGAAIASVLGLLAGWLRRSAR